MAGGTPAEKARRKAARKNYNVTHPGEHDMAYKAARYNHLLYERRNLKSTSPAPTQRGRAVITGNRGGAVVNKGTKKTVTSKPAPKPAVKPSGTASPGLLGAAKKPVASVIKSIPPVKLDIFKYI